MEWKNIYRGMIMGAIDVIPGISSSTIAMLLGIYERLIASINGILSKNWKRHLGFLVPLGIGMVAAIFLFASMIEWLFIHYPVPTRFFFLGLVLGVLPFLFHKADAKRTFKTNHYLLLVLGIIFIACMTYFNPSEGEIIQQITGKTYVMLFFAGFIASCAMILPGVSGSFMLLLLGMYPTVISAISNLQIDIIAVTGMGIVIGVLIMSKVINYFLVHFYTATYAVIIGLVFGSVFAVFPGFSPQLSIMIASIICFAGGITVALLLGRLEYK